MSFQANKTDGDEACPDGEVRQQFGQGSTVEIRCFDEGPESLEIHETQTVNQYKGECPTGTTVTVKPDPS